MLKILIVVTWTFAPQQGVVSRGHTDYVPLVNGFFWQYRATTIKECQQSLAKYTVPQHDKYVVASKEAGAVYTYTAECKVVVS